MKKYRLDRTYGKAQSIEEADDNRIYWLQKNVKERLIAAWYLISCAYGFELENPPGLDKKAFSMRKHKI
jgi:hypothetical protein